MASDFWTSSHYRRWIVDRATVSQARFDDEGYTQLKELPLLGILFANIIAKLSRRLGLRQRVIATAIVYFRRFYLKNSYCDTDPFIVVAACVYVAAKAEETPVHVKTVITDARTMFAGAEYGLKSFPSDNARLAEMEFYLVDDLECDLTVFHPYRALMQLVCKEGSTSNAAAATLDEETGEILPGGGKLVLPDSCIQLAWFIINDTYRSDLICLVHPPHLIAVAALHLALVFNSETRKQCLAPDSVPRRSSRSRKAPMATSSNATATRTVDIVGFLAGLNVNMREVAVIMQEIVGLYKLWSSFKDDTSEADTGTVASDGQQYTTRELVDLLNSIRERREREVAHPATGRPVPPTKMLERASASAVQQTWRAS
ncbi:cyclin-like protein [Auriculariales sp. MPI-PUGE-AT-0066]|nr:cyclin-like protein [Auriculariales sp. MPI-PUGE-AT-0066]